MNKWTPSLIDGYYYWKCKCGKIFKKETPQGIGIAKRNHLRGKKHA